MDAVFPALIGIGLWFCYEAWESGKTGDAPHPIAKVTAALGVASSGGGNTVAGSAPYTGTYGQPATVDGQSVTLPSGVSVAGGGTGAIHG